MITLETLTLNQFMCIKDAAFDFTKNYITIFHGPNGVGKSSVFEAVALCWTERRRGDSYKDFIMHGYDTAKIQLAATIRGEPILFDVEIIDRKGLAPFQRKITYKKQEYTNSECTTLLASFDIDFLQHIMFSMQGDNNITDLKPAERTKLLKKIFSFEFESQIAQLDALIEQENQNLIDLKARQDVYSRNSFDYEKEEDTLTAVEVTNTQKRLAEIDGRIKEIEKEQAQQAGVLQQVTALRAQHTTTINRKHAAEVAIEELTSSKNRLIRDIATHEQSLNALPDPANVEAEIEEKTKAIETLSVLVSTNKTLIREKETLLNTQRSSILELKNHIEAHRKGRCPQCGQDTQPNSVPSLEAKLHSISEDYTSLISQKETLESAEKAAEKNIVTYQAEIPNLRERIASTAITKTQFEKILKTLEEGIARADKSILSEQQVILDLTNQLAILEQQIETLTPKIANAVDTSSLLREKTELSNTLAKNLAAITRNEVIRQKNSKTKIKEQENQKVLAELNQQQNTIVSSITNYRDAKRILEVDLPNYIIVKACSKLEKHVNSFISSIKPGMIVRLFQARSGVEFYYSPTGPVANPGDWTSTKMASGFERELLSAAWRVALARAYKLTTLMLDEIDSAASSGASERVFKEIANLQGFKQLFIITHKSEVVDIISQENDHTLAYAVYDGIFSR